MDGLLSSRTVEARSSGSRARVDDDGAARVSVIAGKFARARACVCVCVCVVAVALMSSATEHCTKPAEEAPTL